MDKLDFIRLLENTTIPEECADAAKYLQPIANALMEIMPPLLFRFRAINEYSLSALDKDLILLSCQRFQRPIRQLINCPKFRDNSKYRSKKSVFFNECVSSTTYRRI